MKVGDKLVILNNTSCNYYCGDDLIKVSWNIDYMSKPSVVTIVDINPLNNCAVKIIWDSGPGYGDYYHISSFFPPCKLLDLCL